MKKVLFIGGPILLMAIVGLAGYFLFVMWPFYYAFNRPDPTKAEIPTSVMNQFLETSSKFRVSPPFGTSIYFCRQGIYAGYEVAGGSGFGGDSYYFDLSGKQIQSHGSGDVFPNEELMQAELDAIKNLPFHDFDCTVLVTNK